MKLNQISQISFKGRIIDSHMHYGHWGKDNKFWGIETLDEFVKNPLDISIDGNKTVDTIDKIIISSLDCINNNPVDEEVGLRNALEFAKNNEKIAVLAVCQPNLTKGDVTQIKKALNKAGNNVVGLKFHPRDLSKTNCGNIIPANHHWYKNYMRVAQEKKLPCLFHCDSDISGARTIYNLIKGEFNDVPVILGHTGAGDDENFFEALDVFKTSLKNNDAKLYCDISWLDWKDGLPDDAHKKIKQLIQESKKRNALDRILFGTDAPLGCFGEKLEGGLSAKEAYEKTVSGLKTMIKQEFEDDSDEIIDMIFYKNAQKLFFLKTKENKKSLSKILLPASIIAGSAIGVAGILISKKIKNKKNIK